MELRDFINLLNKPMFGNPLRAWLFALLFALASYAILYVVLRLVMRRARKIASNTETRMDDLAIELIAATRSSFLLLWALYFWSKPLKLPITLDVTWDRIAVLSLVLQSAVWGTQLIRFWLEHYFHKKTQEDVATATTVSLISTVSRAMLYSMLALVALNNFGVNVTALVAGLGVGGIAVALAAQNILGDLFASLTIVLDKPFVVGDAIKVGEQSGTVEEIGIKTTRVRSATGEQLIFPNADLLQSRVRNYKRMRERQVMLRLAISYDTPLEKLREIPQIVLSTIGDHESQVRSARAHFKEFTETALVYEAEYWVKSPDFALHMDIQQDIGFELMRRFSERGIRFAQPTRTLLVRNAQDMLPSQG